jgi:hypothetical protein
MGCDMPHIVVTVKEGFSLHLYSWSKMSLRRSTPETVHTMCNFPRCSISVISLQSKAWNVLKYSGRSRSTGNVRISE